MKRKKLKHCTKYTKVKITVKWLLKKGNFYSQLACLLVRYKTRFYMYFFSLPLAEQASAAHIEYILYFDLAQIFNNAIKLMFANVAKAKSSSGSNKKNTEKRVKVKGLPFRIYASNIAMHRCSWYVLFIQNCDFCLNIYTFKWLIIKSYERTGNGSEKSN